MDTVLAMGGVFLVALSPLLVGTIVVRALHWVGSRGGRHRRRGTARSERRVGKGRAPTDHPGDSRSRNDT